MGVNVVAKIRQATRKRYTVEEKIRIVLEGLRGEIPFELCDGAEGGTRTPTGFLTPQDGNRYVVAHRKRFLKNCVDLGRGLIFKGPQCYGVLPPWTVQLNVK